VEKAGYDVAQQPARRSFERVDPDRSDRTFDAVADRCQHVIQIPQRWHQSRQKERARLRWCNTARSAIEQSDSELLLESDNSMTKRRTRHSKFVGGGAEASVSRYRGEGCQINERGLCHWCQYFTNLCRNASLNSTV
jgi:hypothetical protein